MNVTFNLELAHRANRDGRHNIVLRITADRKHTRIKTGISVKPGEFDKEAKYGQWIVKHNDRKNLNTDLKDVIVKAEAQHKELEKQGPVVSSMAVAYSLQNKPTGEVWTVGSFADKIIADHATQSVGYERNIKSRLTVFANFVGRNKPLTSVTLETLNRFKRQLRAEGKMPGTQHTYFNRIRKMFLEALKLEIIPKDPFKHFTMPPDTPAPRLKLSDTQIIAIEALNVSESRIDTLGRNYGPSIWLFRAKWLYLFSYYMGGIRSRDILQLRWGNIVGEKDALRLEYQTSKKGKLMSTRLNSKAQQIVDLFKNDTPSKSTDYLFGVLENDASYVSYMTYEEKKKMSRDLQEQLFNDISSAQVLINRQLKTLAEKLDIKEDLTFHTSRHSFADKARRRMKESKNISIDDIRLALGHDKLDTTQKYLNSFDRESLDSAMDAVFDE